MPSQSHSQYSHNSQKPSHKALGWELCEYCEYCEASSNGHDCEPTCPCSKKTFGITDTQKMIRPYGEYQFRDLSQLIASRTEINTMSEPEVVMYIKTYETRMPNAKLSLKRPIDLKSIVSIIPQPQRQAVENEQRLSSLIYAWDFAVRCSPYIRENDTVAIFTNDEVFYGACFKKIVDPLGKIGDALGWARMYGALWKNPMLLINIKTFKINSDNSIHLNNILQNSKMLEKNFYKTGINDFSSLHNLHQDNAKD